MVYIGEALKELLVQGAQAESVPAEVQSRTGHHTENEVIKHHSSNKQYDGKSLANQNQPGRKSENT